MRGLLVLLAAVLFGSGASACDGCAKLRAGTVPELRVKEHGLARIKADDVDPKAALVWRVYPSVNVVRATNPKGVFEFAAPPGQYSVELLVIKVDKDGALSTDERSITVVFEGVKKPDEPAPKPKDGEQGVLAPAKAIGKIQFGPYGCSATVIGPRRSDGRWDVLTAAHCVEGLKAGDQGSMKLLDGRTFKVRVANVNPTPDIAWLTTEESVSDMPYANLAADVPANGTKLWHAGYGVDVPGNREEGVVDGGLDSNGQIRMVLSVSSGDSGGGIFREDTNELIACVCCTTSKGKRASVWGGSAKVAAGLRPKAALTFNWNPVEIPVITIRP